MEQLLTPSALIFLLLFVGVALFIVLRQRALSIVPLATAVFLYAFFGSPWVATWLLGTLEHAPMPKDTTATPSAIVILTGYARADRALPITGQLNNASAFRVLEASRLLSNERLPVHISGFGPVPGLLADALRAVQSEPLVIHLDTQASNTHESAVNLRHRLGTVPFYLVTSAGHMPRSMAVFRTQGMQPIPAPTDFYTSRENSSHDFLPSAYALAMSDLAIHERIGMLWYRLHGWIADSDEPNLRAGTVHSETD